MRSRFLTTYLPTAMLSVCLVGGASAQGIESPYRFINTNQAGGLYSGYVFTDGGNLDFGPESALIYGARYDLAIGGGPFAVEADIGYFSSMRAVYDTIPGDTSRIRIGEADASTLMLNVGMRFNFTGPRTYRGFQPYALFGGGYAFDLSSDAPVEEDLPPNVRFEFGSGFMGMIGGGAEFILGERMSARLDIRNLLWKLGTPEGFLLQGNQGRLLPGDEWAQNFSLTAGFAFRF